MLRVIDKHAMIGYNYAIDMYEKANGFGYSEIAYELAEIMDMFATVRLKANHCINIINRVAP